jgi:NitT/TauT family transport system ATP-binding protein
MPGSAVAANPSAVRVRVSDVSKTFTPDVRVLRDFSLEIPPAEFLAILGPSGCGKSTLLRLIAGLDAPTAGSIQRGAGDEAFSYVFQDAHLLPWRNVLRNVTLPLELREGMSAGERAGVAEEALKQVGLSEALLRYPAQLSGGMRMRVSLARALVTEPRLLLLDEPFAALDEITRHRLDEQLRQLWTTREMTVVFVTHSIPEATYLSQRVVVMSPRPGRIVLDHRVELPEERTSELRGEAAFAREMRELYRALEQGGA